MEHLETQIRIFQQGDGRVPYLEWFSGLRDRQARQKIQVRLARLRLGNLGQARSLGEGVHELKIDHGPGYRVYFGRMGNAIVILLCGGDKGSQERDIRRAREYWQDFLKERQHADG